jgi:hypothetical protein
MKKITAFGLAIVLAATAFAADPTEKVLKAFKTTFRDAQNVVWWDGTGQYTVKFTQQGVNTYVKYDEDGNFVSSRRYYTGNKLPVDIQCALKKKYADKTVYGVTEFTVGSDIAYFVKLEGEKDWTTVKVDGDRNMEVTEKYGKL